MLILRVLGLAIGLVGCVYDPSDPCGSSMHFDTTLRSCVCDDNAVVVTGGCKACSDDEVVVGTACACPAGQTKNADNVCAAVAGLGNACDGAKPCTDATYSMCAPSTAGTTAGTCTKACASNDDCDAAYTCATWEAEPYCRQFGGVGDTCASADDCADGDAKFCDTFQTHSCIVAGCTLDGDECPRGQQCCDFSSFGIGTLCAAACL